MSNQELRSEFINESSGTVGVVLFDRRGERGGGVVKPGESIWLTEEEEVATANAPKKPSDNPFINGMLRMVTPAEQMVSKRPIGSRESAAAPIEPSKAPKGPEELVEPPRVERDATEEVGAPPLPEGDPEEGVRQPAEEVGNPQVVKTENARKKKTPERGVTVQSGPPGGAEEVAPGDTPVGVVVGTRGAEYVGAR